MGKASPMACPAAVSLNSPFNLTFPILMVMAFGIAVSPR
jgi:hypothetical protein